MMMNDSRLTVSVVIPVYNGEKFLAETLESVLSQTYPHVECVLVNDGSTDNTAAIAASFGDKIRYFEKANGGVSAARNFGIRRASGDFIAFLDADDLWLPEKIEKQMRLFEKQEDLGLVYCGCEIADENKNTIGYKTPVEGKDLLENTLLLKREIGAMSTTGIVPKKIFDAVGLFDESLSTGADADLVCRIGFRFPLSFVSETLALYRQHGNQMHLNLAAFEHDMNVIYEKVFSRADLPPEIKKMEKKCRTNLALTLAIGFSSGKKDYRKGLKYFLDALGSDSFFTMKRLSSIFMRRFLGASKV